MDLVAQREAQIAQGVVFETSGARVVRDLEFGEWRTALLTAVQSRQSAAWQIGDLLVYAEERPPGWLRADDAENGRQPNCRVEWGLYRLVERLTGYSYQTLVGKAAVSRAFPPGKRLPVEQTSWSMHRSAILLPLDDRLPTLRRAALEKWTLVKMTTHVAQVNAKRRAAGEKIRPAPKKKEPSRLRCPHCHTEFVPTPEDWLPPSA